MQSTMSTSAKCMPDSLGFSEAKSLSAQPQRNQPDNLTYSPIIGSQDVAAWLERHAPAELVIQRIPPGRRPKNKCVLTLREHGQTITVGAPSIRAAIFRAQARQAAEAAKGSNT